MHVCVYVHMCVCTCVCVCVPENDDALSIAVVGTRWSVHCTVYRGACFVYGECSFTFNMPSERISK